MTNPLVPYLEPLPFIAVLRGITPEEIPAIGAALVAEGLRILEVPLNSPRPFESIRLLAEKFGERCLVGAGTVLAADEVAQVCAAGGRLIVMPHGDAAVIREAKRQGRVCVPGVATPTEAFAALAAGADGLKMFPAEQLPAATLKAWRAVLPAGDAGVSGRRDSARQHGPVLGRRRRRIRHGLEPLPARHVGRGSRAGCRRVRAGIPRASVARAADDPARDDDTSRAPTRRRRARRGDGRVQPGARGGTRFLPARFRRRHVEHGDRRVAPRRAAAYVTRVGDDAFGRALLRPMGGRRMWTRAASRSMSMRPPASTSSRTGPAGMSSPTCARGRPRRGCNPASLPLAADSQRTSAAPVGHQPGDQRGRLRRGVRGDRRGQGGRRPRFLRPQSAAEAVAACPGARGRAGDGRAVRLVPAESRRGAPALGSDATGSDSRLVPPRRVRPWSLSSAAAMALSSRTVAASSGSPVMRWIASTQPVRATASTGRSRRG